MQTVDEKPETIHLYVVREAEPRPSSIPVILSVVALSLVVAIGLALPFTQPEPRASIRVPAVLLPLRTFRVQVQGVPTGVKTYPATTAHGTLTITNGSVLSEVLPAGIIFSGRNGAEVQTMQSVFIPAGSASGYGMATVPARAVVAGKAGNIPTLAINAVYGTALYVRNLIAFRGGANSYSVMVATTQDKQLALTQARSLLAMKVKGLHYPCQELYVSDGLQIHMTWRCQFVTYHVPAYMRVTGVRIQGKNLILDVVFVACQECIWAR